MFDTCFRNMWFQLLHIINSVCKFTWVLHIFWHVWHMFQKTCAFSFYTLLAKCGILHWFLAHFWHVWHIFHKTCDFSFYTYTCFRKHVILWFTQRFFKFSHSPQFHKAQANEFMHNFKKNVNLPRLLHIINKVSTPADPGTFLGHLFLPVKNEGKTTLLHNTPNKNMGDPQFYLHGSAFSTTLSTRGRKQLQFYLRGSAFSNFRMHLSSTKLKQMSFWQNFNTKAIILLKSFTRDHKMCNVYTSSCTFSDMFDTRFRKHAILLGFCAHCWQHA